jgi:hypothetical protein
MKLACLLLLLANAVFAQTNAPASAVFELQKFVDRELQAGNHHIILPRGRYRVTPHDRQHLVLRDLKDVKIIADGFEMICTETTRALTISHCTNVTVRGLVIDYDPLPFTQGRIVAFAGGKKIQDIELFAGYPAADQARNFKYEIFRPDTRTLRGDDRYPSQVEVTGPRRLRIHLPGGHENDPEQVGDLIVIGAEYAPHGSAAHAVECSHNVNVRLENIDLFASNCFGFIEDNCDGSTYYRCRIDRRSAADDLAPRGDARLRSLDADAFHSTGAVKGPAYLECTARYMGDDAVNIHGDYHLIMSAQGRELRVLAKNEMNLHPGDPVELVTYEGVRLPDAKIVAVQPAGAIRDEERAFLSRQQMDAGLKAAKNALTKAYAVTLDRAENLPMGSVIGAANRIGNGFAVKDCRFGFNRSRGILIKASHGEITGNRVEGSRMSAILVSPEYWWLEAGSSSDLTISNNSISACGGIPICVEATGGNGQIAPAGAHRDLRITGNAIQNCSPPGILVTSTTGLVIADNQFDLFPATNAVPALMRRAGLKILRPVVKIDCGTQSDAE